MAYDKRYYDKHKNDKGFKGKKTAYDRERRKSNPEKEAARLKVYYQKNKKKILAQQKEYREADPEKQAARSKKYQEKNKGKRLVHQKEYRDENKGKRNEQLKNRRTTDPMYRFETNIRALIGYALKGTSYGTIRHLPYTGEMLMRHLERHFEKGMTWDNYGRGGWVIDHIRPTSSFKITSADCKGFKDCWALENLQPMWEKDNFEKSNKIEARYKNM